jgi:phosphoribosyl 1,2-cyclic phosphodiesterase
MKLSFWGVRGSIAVPGPATVRYGGNTTCIEVRTSADDLIVLDGGTGIFQLAQSLLPRLPIDAHIFLTHTHWDHIQGLPFFTPVFIPGNTVRLHGAFDPVLGTGVEQALAVQMQYSFFPVREAELRARIEYRTLTPGEALAVGAAWVTPQLMNHPVVDLGYRVQEGERSVFFTGDHEPHTNIYPPDDPAHAGYQALIDERRAAIVQAMAGVDVLVADAAYTPEEYRSRQGWGHGTFDSCIDLGVAAGAQRIVLTHHEPTRSDAALEAVFAEALQRAAERHGTAQLPPIDLAYEGLTIDLGE